MFALLYNAHATRVNNVNQGKKTEIVLKIWCVLLKCRQMVGGYEWVYLTLSVRVLCLLFLFYSY